MNKRWCCGRFLCSVVLLLLPFSGASAFAAAERLEYNLFWGGIKAGRATLEMARTAEGVKIVSTANSADWLSLFYTVDDRVESVLSATSNSELLGTPLRYRVKLREGRHRRDKEVVFDNTRYRAVCQDFIEKERSEVEFRGRFFDPLSCLYYVRRVPPEIGKTMHVEVFDNKRLWNVEVKFLRRERVQTPAGDFDTVLIKPMLKSEGLFIRKGDIYIWLSSDARRLPVKMQTKMKLGSVTALLAGGQY